VDWALFVAIATGVLMGSLLRVFALIVSCGLLLVLVIVLGVSAELPATSIVVAALAVTCAHQISYLAGLLIHHFWQRMKWKRSIGRAEHS
jgi:membrane protein DedA with SNARE-associated domain